MSFVTLATKGNVGVVPLQGSGQLKDLSQGWKDETRQMLILDAFLMHHSQEVQSSSWRKEKKNQ